MDSMLVSSSDPGSATAVSGALYEGRFSDRDGLPLDSLSFSRKKSILDSRYVLDGRGRALLDFVLGTGSNASRLGLPASSDGRDDEACLIWPGRVDVEFLGILAAYRD